MTTEIMFILDRSGSMSACAADAVGGFNEYLKAQKKNPRGKRLTLLQFDHRIEFTYESAKPKDCKPLELGKTYEPRGTTALLDAIGTGLDCIKDAKKAIVAIYTDGLENASREWTAEGVKAALKRAEEKGWEVLFLASDINTDFAVHTLGMPKHRVAAVKGASVGASMRTVAARATNYAATGKASADSLQGDYDNAVAGKRPSVTTATGND